MQNEWVLHIPKPTGEQVVYGFFAFLFVVFVILPTYRVLRELGRMQ